MNDKQSKQRITVTIVNRPYSLFIEREKLKEQEPLARRAAELMNDRVDQYWRKFSQSEHQDLQDILAMAAWDIAYDFLKLEQTEDARLLAQDVRSIDERLENYLQQHSLPTEDE